MAPSGITAGTALLETKKGVIGRRFAQAGQVGKKVKTLGEAIIMQAIEDLYNPLHRAESVEFFKSDNFSHCAELAGINEVEKFRLLMMIDRAGLGVGR